MKSRSFTIAQYCWFPSDSFHANRRLLVTRIEACMARVWRRIGDIVNTTLLTTVALPNESVARRVSRAVHYCNVTEILKLCEYYVVRPSFKEMVRD